MKTIRRKSKQREKIYELIKSSTGHPTAQWVYKTLKKEMPSLSLGNVYRNIKILSEQGRIVSREFGDGIEHYDAITEMHYHFNCEKCKNVSDFPMPVQELITKKAQKISVHCITGHTIQFYGICEKCNGAKGSKNI
jgi:Fur family transcriptional regulator, peroxide stress response regulator